MDSDTSDEFMSPESARKRINVRVLSSDNDQAGSIETVLGNTLVSYTLPLGSNTVIGSYEYIKTKKIYYFVYNSLSNHTILEYDYTLDAVTLVLQEAVSAPYYLRFSPDYLITGITVVELNRDNHLLGWTDNYVNPADANDYNEPKKLNIEKAKAFSAGDFVNGYPSPFEPRFITRIKQPSPIAPTYVWSNDTAQKLNYLLYKFFVFKVQFVYDDGEMSTWSPVSRYVFPATIPMTGSGVTGENYNEQDNKITITVPTGSGIVTRVRIAAKQIGLNDYSLVADLNKENLNISSDTTYDFPFYNDGNYVQVANVESEALYSNVPQRAKAEEFTEGRLFWGNVTENFDPVNIDMRLPLSFELLDSPANAFFVDKTFLKSGGTYKYAIVYYDDYGNRSGLSNITSGKTTEYVNDRFGTTLYVPFLTDPLYAAPHGTPNLDMQYVPQVLAQIYNRPPAWATRYQILRTKNESMGRYIQFVAQSIHYTDSSGLSPFIPPASASRVIISLANITSRYSLENPQSKLVYDYASGDRVRFIANPDYSSIPANEYNAPYVPPYFFSSPSPGRAGDTITTFFPFNDTPIVSYTSSAGTFEILIDPANPTVPLDLLPGCLFEIYQPAESVLNDNELTYEITEEGTLGLDIYGNLIHEASGGNQAIVPMTASSFVGPVYTATVPAGHGLLVGDNVKLIQPFFYSVYGVITAATATTVAIDTTGFTLVGFYTSGSGEIIKAAERVLESGDCFRRLCDMPYVIPFQGHVFRLYSYIETSRASNMFTSDASDYGRPNRIDPTIKRTTREATAFWSEVFVPETDINGLSMVYLDTNFQGYDLRYGGIQKFFAEDMGLITLQELKCSLIPIQRLIYSDAAGVNSIGISDNVMSPQADYYAGEFGIGLHPESFAVFGPAKYFIDVNRGVVLRLSRDGLTPISDTGSMHNYFTDKCKEVLGYTSKINIYGVYDQKFNEYIISFQGVGNPDSDPYIAHATLAWNEKENQWSTFYSYAPEYMCSSNTGIISFNAGRLYKHNTNGVYNNFYGVQYNSEFWVLCNAAPSNVKILEAIYEETDTAWEAFEITSPSGQLTNLIASDFQFIEDNQFAPLWRDENTPNVTNPLFEGDVMRGRTFLAKFRYTGADYNKINAVDFQYILSNLNNQE